MSKIVFVKPPLPLEKLYGKLGSGGNEMPPLGLCSLAAAVRENGYDTAIVDALPLKLNYEQTSDLILTHRPKYIGLTAVTVSIHDAAKVATILKDKDKNLVTIIGGPHVTAAPIETLERFPQFDIGVIGEGEVTIVELMRVLENNGDLSEVKGLIIRQNGRLSLTKPRPFIRNLDTLPMPAWDLLPNLAKYYQPAADTILRLPSTSMVTSRGCSGKCTFCDRSVFGNFCRAHSAEYVMDMIKHLYYNYGIRDIHIYEDNFTLHKPRLIKICNMLIEEKMDLSFFCMARVDTVTPEILRLMKKAGFWQIAYGIESGSQKILDNINKGVTVEQNKRTLRWTKEAGIKNQGYFMLGNFGETEETIRETLDFIKRTPVDDFHITYFTPFPGSPAYEEVDRFGTFDKDWERVDEFSPNFIPNGLTAEQLKRYHKLAYATFYLRPGIIFYYLWKMVKGPRIALKLLRGLKGFVSYVVSSR